MSDRVYIFDTTLRDGEQSPGCSMTTSEKLRMAEKLVDLGVDLMEAGFPIASQAVWATPMPRRKSRTFIWMVKRPRRSPPCLMNWWTRFP